MYSNEDEMNKEVVFTRLLRAFDCFDDEEVGCSLDDMDYREESLEYPIDVTYDYVRYKEAENIIDAVMAITDDKYKLVYDYEILNPDESIIDIGIKPLFNYKAVMIDYDLDRFIDNGYFRCIIGTEIWMTDCYDFYTVECSETTVGGVKRTQRHIISCASEDRKIGTYMSDFIKGIWNVYNGDNVKDPD